MPLEPYKEVFFPNLNRGEYRVTSEASTRYNCIAWAAGVNTNWWWPDPDPDGNTYWPDLAPSEETLASFRIVFESLGYRNAPLRNWNPALRR